MRMWLVGVGFVVMATAAYGEGIQSGVITGVVLDASGAVLPNIDVTLAGPGLIGGPRHADTDGTGRYRFAGLLPGTYEVTATAPGLVSGSPARADLPVGATLTIDLVLAVAGPVEQVEVRERVAADLRSASIPAHLDRRLLEHLPTSRAVAGVINLAPGVFNDVAFGGTQLSNALYVDGVDVTEPRVQDPWVTVNYNWLEHVEVAALGAGD